MTLPDFREALPTTLLRVQESIELALTGADTDQTVNQGLDRVEENVQAWLNLVEEAQSAIARQQRPGQVHGTMELEQWTLGMLNVAVAVDLTRLAPFDLGHNGGDPRTAWEEGRAALIEESGREIPSWEEAVGDDFAIRRFAIPLSVVLVEGVPDDPERADEAYGNDENDDDATPEDSPSPSNPAPPDPVVEATVDKLVERAAKQTRAIATATVGSHLLDLLQLPSLSGLLPGQIHVAIDRLSGRVKRLIAMVLRKGHDLLSGLLARFPDIRAAITAAGPIAVQEVGIYAPERLANRMIGHAMSARKVKSEGNHAIADITTVDRRDQAYERIKKLDGNHKYIVGGARLAAKGIPFAWGVTAVAGIPLAPIIAAVLLVWTLAWTGDMLDAPGPFPRIWAGPGARAQEFADPQ